LLCGAVVPAKTYAESVGAFRERSEGGDNAYREILYR